MKLFFQFVFAISISMICGAQEARAGIWDDYLAQVEGEFDRASTPQKKYEIISSPFNREHLRGLKSVSEIDPVKLRQDVGKGAFSFHTSEGKEKLNVNKMTALNLAISLGNVSVVRNFLSVVSDINADELTSWGYRQPYYPAHFALHPEYPSSSTPNSGAQLEIIDLLAEKGADFNTIFPHREIGVYLNPPLSAGGSSGSVKYEDKNRLQARALLYGANPELRGSSFCGVELIYRSRVYAPVTKNTLLYYYEVVKARGIASVCPHPVMMSMLEEYSRSIGLISRVFKTLQKKETLV